MDKIFFKKNKGVFVSYALIGLACSFLIITSWLVSFSLSDIDNQIRNLERRFYGGGKTNRTMDEGSIGFLRDIKGSFDKNYSEYASGFLEEPLSNKEILNPLVFKQKLFELQDMLKNKADNAKVYLPAGLGFAEYELKVPEPSEIENLIKELMMTEKIVNMLINNRVAGIEKIEFAGRDIKSKESQTKKRDSLFDSKEMRLEIKTGFEGVKGFMEDLAKEKSVFVIKKLYIQRLEKENGILYCKIEVVQFQ